MTRASKVVRAPLNRLLRRIRRLPGDLERSLYLKRLAALTNLDVELLQSKVRGGAVAQASGASCGSSVTRQHVSRRQRQDKPRNTCYA